MNIGRNERVYNSPSRAVGTSGNALAGGQSLEKGVALGNEGSSWEQSPAYLLDEDEIKKAGYKSSPQECQTCKTRKYQDGSNEMVSFKAPGHIDPNNAAAVVLSHEREHVANAYQKAELKNGKVERASIRLTTDICPECGRSYISGGETSTQIKYYNEENPYQEQLKKSDAANKLRGLHLDFDV